MQGINWDCCPLVAQNPIMRAFIEQLAKERKAASTIPRDAQRESKRVERGTLSWEARLDRCRWNTYQDGF